MSQVIATLLGTDGACDLADAAAKAVYGSLCGFAQMRFNFTEAVLDRVEIESIEADNAALHRQIQSPRAPPVLCAKADYP